MLPDWSRAWPELSAVAVFKQSPADFEVEEVFDLDASDDGEFNWLWVQKCGANTEDVAAKLSSLAGIQRRAVSYSGLKDRHAVTRQWFCLHLGGKAAPDWHMLNSGNDFQILSSVRHRKKLRPGTHQGNRFVIRLREVQGASVESLNERLACIASEGVPNYFGEQRFGHDGGNIDKARAWLVEGGRGPKRFQRGMYLSAARSYLFNQILAARVEAGSWNQAIDGDVFALRDSNSVFSEPLTDELIERVVAGELHPTAPLFGKAGNRETTGEAARFEKAVLEEEQALCEGLLRERLDSQRRALRLIPRDFEWQWLGGDLVLSFGLRKGCFATAVVRELIRYSL